MVRLGITGLAMIILGSRSMVVSKAALWSLETGRSVGGCLSSLLTEQDWIVSYFMLRVDLAISVALIPNLSEMAGKSF